MQTDYTDIEYFKAKVKNCEQELSKAVLTNRKAEYSRWQCPISEARRRLKKTKRQLWQLVSAQASFEEMRSNRVDFVEERIY